MERVALWAPEIRPPDHWLAAAVLYQDRISTIAPPTQLPGPDGREAADLASLLGDLWQPLRFMSGAELQIPDIVNELLPSWQRRASSMLEDRFTELWLRRVEGRTTRAMRLSRQLEKKREELAGISGERIEEASRHVLDMSLDLVRSQRQRIEARLEEIKSDVEAAKTTRVAKLQPLIDLRRELEQRRSYGEEHKALVTALRLASQRMQREDPVTAEFERLQSELWHVDREEKDARYEHERLFEDRHNLERQIRRLESQIRAPYLDDNRH